MAPILVSAIQELSMIQQLDRTRVDTELFRGINREAFC